MKPRFLSPLVGTFLMVAGHASMGHGQSLSDSQQNFLNANARSFSVNERKDLDDLRFLRSAVRGKRIVLVGEFTHGARECNLVRNRLVAYLHEKLGFNVLLFESGIGEVHVIDTARAERPARALLNAGLVGPWRTNEMLSLIEYIKARPALRVGGFDVQRSGGGFANELRKIATDIGYEFRDGDNVETRFAAIASKLNSRNTPLDEAVMLEKNLLILDYRKLIELNARRKGADPADQKIIGRTLENRIRYLEYFAEFRKDNNFRRRWAARDRMMAENVMWFANEFPKEKLIIVGHNFHTAKFNAKEEVMGEILYEKFGDSMYSIGVFGGQGEIANNSRTPEKMKIPLSGDDVQAAALALKAESAFLDMPDKARPGSDFLFREIAVKNSFVDLDSTDKLDLSKSFDGLIFIKTISLPVFMN